METTIHARESVAFDDVITIQDTSGEAVPITGWSFTSDLMRRAGAVDIALGSVSAGSQGFTVADGPAGRLRIRINQATLAGIADTTGNFTLFGDLLGTPPGGEAMFVAQLHVAITTAGEAFRGRTYKVVLEAFAGMVLAEVNGAGASQVAAVTSAGATQLAAVAAEGAEQIARAESAADEAKAWASSPTPPDPSDASSESAKTIADRILATSLNAKEYERSGYAEAVVDEDFRIITSVSKAGFSRVGTVNVELAASDLASSLGMLATTEWERSGYFDVVVDEDGRMLFGMNAQGQVYVEGVRVATGGNEPTVPEAPIDGGLYARRNSAWEPLEGITPRTAAIFIAAHNAPDYQKAVADYICTGVNDHLVIQNVMDNLPLLPPRIITGCDVTGGRGGMIQLSLGVFHFGEKLTFPSGSVIHFYGSGLSADRFDRLPDETSTNPGTPISDGGTVIYCTDNSGRILHWPRGYWPRRDDPNEIDEVPASGIYVGGFHAYIKNPSVVQSVSAIDCVGMATGRVENIYLIGLPRSGAKINTGFGFGGGARSDNKEVFHCVASGFRRSGFAIATTHLNMDQCTANYIGGESDSCGFRLTYDNGITIGYIHCFATGIGIATLGEGQIGAGQLHIQHADFESLQTAVLLGDKTNPLHFSNVSSENPSTIWEGDLANYCIVDSASRVGGRVRVEGKITIPAGQTTATQVLGMCGVPRIVHATPNSAAGSGVFASATKTLLTVSIPSPAVADAVISFDVRCA